MEEHAINQLDNIKKFIIVLLLLSVLSFYSCQNNIKAEIPAKVETLILEPTSIDDSRISLNLNSMQKNHQLSNMRSHLKAVQDITLLLSQ